MEHLRTIKMDHLKSLALFSKIEGSFDQQIKEIEKISLQLAKIDYWLDHIYPSYFENGNEIELNNT